MKTGMKKSSSLFIFQKRLLHIYIMNNPIGGFLQKNKFILLAALIPLVYLIGIMENMDFVTNILKGIILLPGLITVAVLILKTKLLTGVISERQSQLLAVGVGLLVIGDAIRIFFINDLLIDHSFAAWENWIMMAGYLFVAGGWMLSSEIFKHQLIRLKLILDIVISSSAFALLGWLIFVSPINVLMSPDSGRLDWPLVYPVLDLILFGILINLAFLKRISKDQWLLTGFIIGVIGFLISDLSPASFTPGQPFTPGTGADLGMLIGFSSILSGILLVLKQASAGQVITSDDDNWIMGRRIQGILPLATAVVLVVELIIAYQSRIEIPQIVLGFTAVIWLLLIARQGVAAGEFELRQYAMLLQNSAEPSFITDEKMKLILVNPAMIRICGQENSAQVLGRTLGEIFGDPTIPKNVNESWSSEVHLNLSNSIYLPIELSLNRINLDSPGKQRIAGTAHDLTSQKEQQSALIMANQRLSDLQGELERMNENLEQRVVEKTRSLQEAYQQLEEQHTKLQSLDKMKSDFVSMVSHELRAPLTNISGGIELTLSGRDPVPARVDQTLKVVQAEIKRLTTFVETILDLSALEAGKLPIFVEPLNLNNIISKTIDNYSGLAEVERIKYQVDMPNAVVVADPRALSSVLFHLLDNALKYDQSGEVLVRSGRIGDNILVSIRDHGPGIPEERQPFIFEKFYRGNPADSQYVYGHGLGLYMAGKMMEAMNGEIKVENRDDGGAEFSFSLPILKE